MSHQSIMHVSLSGKSRAPITSGTEAGDKMSTTIHYFNAPLFCSHFCLAVLLFQVLVACSAQCCCSRCAQWSELRRFELESVWMPVGLWGAASSCPLHHYPPAMPHLIIRSQPAWLRVEGSLPAAGSHTSLLVRWWNKAAIYINRYQIIIIIILNDQSESLVKTAHRGLTPWLDVW